MIIYLIQKNDLRTIALVEQDIQSQLGHADSTEQVTIEDYQPEKIKIVTTSNQNSLLVLTDNYFPGWKAYIDGKETTIYRANYTFRGIVVPLGTHTVQFRYEPVSIKIALTLCAFGSGILLVILFGKLKKVKSDR